MALPFILGLAVGAGAILAYKNSDKLQGKVNEALGKGKEFASTSLEKGKDVVGEVKDTINATTECIKDKKNRDKKVEELEEVCEKTKEDK